ncbi:MAG: tetratricopeptide repeat protein [Hymenobacteraceae bacterium]|nr:tetratricopeptide repeat protein [Hymenobacteraceae bacterium]MDX5395787.1 tetratricopeptide repeat protein [Hymenobacteraceae bacterium]MDX5511842.1 tetratricopeptide repeat protein [Hymenobacteraceae bacterium]
MQLKWMRSFWVLVVALVAFTQVALAQNQDLALAREYFRKGEYEKADAIYSKLIDNNQLYQVVYPEYLQTLLALQQYKDAEKLVKKTIKKYQGVPLYEVDLGRVYLARGDKEAAEKYFNKLIANLNKPSVVAAANAFEQHQLYEFAEKTYLHGRKESKNELEYYRQLLQLYLYQKKTDKLIEEALQVMRLDPAQMPMLQAVLQNNLKEDKEFDQLERALIAGLQKHPDQTAYTELLIWLYIQKKYFAIALMQARSLDKRTRGNGTKIMELGAISLKNQDYQAAIDAFEYVLREYKNGPYYTAARQRLINAREEQVRNTFPVDKVKIQELITDYEAFLAELGRNARTAEVMRNMAMLYAFYLDEKDKAIAMLEEVIQTPRADADLVAEAKLALGDIYLLKGEPWESTLLYSQVEKSHKETPIGHEAKLRNAKLNYYKGDFELAQEHLDILKLATSREIANDAMQLSLLITDNTGLDTSTAAMEDYAKADLLLFQNKHQEALTLLDNMLRKYPAHSLTDEIFYKKAQLFLQMGDFNNAIVNLENIIQNPKYDILSDDALFMLAKIYEENLSKPEKAKELYNDLLVKYPGSTFVVEARKRFRKLRGDAAVN